MQMVDIADREYRSEKRRFEDAEKDLRERLREAREDLERERKARESGNERESADARQLGALRRRVEELESECATLKESNQKHRKEALMSKSAEQRVEWLEGETARARAQLAASEAVLKQLKADLQLEKSTSTKYESELIKIKKERDALAQEMEDKQAIIVQLKARVEEQTTRLAAATSNLTKSGGLDSREAALAKRETVLEAERSTLNAEKDEIKASFANLKLREAACASREKALAKEEKTMAAATNRPVAAEPARGKELVTVARTPEASPKTSTAVVSRFAEIARRFVFTPGMNARADSPTPNKSPLSDTSKQLFAAVVNKAQSTAKASASKTEQATATAAAGVFGVLQSVVGKSTSGGGSALPSPPPQKQLASQNLFPSSPRKDKPDTKERTEKDRPEATTSVVQTTKAAEPAAKPTRSKRRTESQTASEAQEPARSSRRTQTTAVAEESVTEARGSDAAKVPRKRGRPPKHPTAPAKEEEETETEQPVAKKSRGRPRKQVVDSEAPSEAPSKRPRGRPKKSGAGGDDTVSENTESAVRSESRAVKRVELKHLQDFLGSGKKEVEPVLRRGARRAAALRD